ncbi:MAG: CorA-like Mg2+ transporter protein [Candidatus Scalindua rubra]|uniref:CorA-like Mg2+ transporter protein n=1 Tax=Candidatus Scalindua rubra TaxID=1872076 RepID=A0A1E3XAJ4_9BACT|nr:MAG: CorA-like Mg2+ transporter protein [Candidatus Scalindua rubra]
MNLYVEFSPNEKVCQELASFPPDALSVPEKFYWLDIEKKDITEEDEILKILNIKNSSLENYSSDKPVPIYEETEDYMNLDMLSFRGDGAKLAPCKLKVVLGNNFFLTLHEEPLKIVDKLKQEYERNFLIAGKSPGFLIFLIFDFFIGNVLHIMFSLDKNMDEIEGEISGGRFSEEVLQDIFQIRRYILTIKKSVEPASNILI